MKVKILKFDASKNYYNKQNHDLIEMNTAEAEAELNRFILDKDVIDIKTNTITTHRHNNGGNDSNTIIYTILYKTR